MDYVIRGRGFICQNMDILQSLVDIEKTVVLSRKGVPVRLRGLAQAQVGPNYRCGANDLNGIEAVGGVVVPRLVVAGGSLDAKVTAKKRLWVWLVS